MIDIRILTASDVPQYQSLRLYSFQEAPFAFSESYEDESSRTADSFQEEVSTGGSTKEQFILGGFDGDKQLQGFVKFRRDQRTKARHKSMVHAMYVHPRYRGQGLGAALMTELISRARRMPGLEQIHLWVLHAADSASDFYKSCGFKSQGPLVRRDLKFEGQYIDAEYMVLYLDEIK